MNIESFTPEVVSATSARRVSERKKVITLVEKNFFKKTYKPKNQKVSSDTDNKLNLKELLSKKEESNSFSLAAQSILPALRPDRCQSKAIQTYRAKKLKQMYTTEAAMKEAFAKHKALGLNPYLLQNFRRVAPNGKSLFALARVRDTLGRFNNELPLSKPHSSQDSTVDTRDDCPTETQTTADGSLLSLFSFDRPARALTPQGTLFDFDSLYESSCRGSAAVDPRPNRRTAGSSGLPRDSEAAPIMRSETTGEKLMSAAAGLQKLPCWESAAPDLDDSLEAQRHPCDIFSEPLDEDLLSMDDLFGCE